MAAPYSDDLRSRVLGAYARGMATKDVAEMFEVCPSWARRVKQRHRESGERSHRAMGGRRFEKIDRRRLAELVSVKPDATLNELRNQLGVVCALSAVCMALKKLGLSFKKRRSMPRSRTARTSRSGARRGGSVSRAWTRRG